MDNLAVQSLNLVARLSGQEEGPAPIPSLDRMTIEGAYRGALRRWFELTAQGPRLFAFSL